MISTLLIFFGIVYAAIILFSFYGWRRIKAYQVVEANFQTTVSVIVAARNEEINILNCLNAIARQSYPANLFEIVIVDDRSEDNTLSLVKAWLSNHSVCNKIISPETGTGKKNALNHGIKNSSNELIVTTDADCTMEKNWLSTIVSYYETHSPSMIVGMVSLKKEPDFLPSFQSLELTGLTAIGAAGIYFKRPLLCNGANLAYRKSAFESAGNYNIADESASGDDTLLMFRITKQNPSGVHFLKSKEAVVSTRSTSSLSEMFNQRKRWGSKVMRQRNSFSVIIAVIVVLFHVSALASVILFVANITSWKIFLFLFFLKIIPEIILLNDALSFSGNKKSPFRIILSQIIYPFYLILVAVLSQTGSYQWKERKVK